MGNKMNVNAALQCSLWVFEQYSELQIEQFGNQELGALELAIQANNSQLWSSIQIGIGKEFLECVGMWMIYTGQDDCMDTIREVLNDVKVNI